LTVQFIDLVGSTTLSQQLDPEDYHARVVAYQTACHQVIARYEGHIAQYLGDGVLVYFGYPAAHDEDAVLAVRSGLEIVAAVGQLPFLPPLQVRIGIHTGPVMVGEIGAGECTERLAVGETPNLAARVQGHAAPNTVVISGATYRLVHGIFRCEALGPQALRNVAVPLELYWVQGEGEAQSRFEVAIRTGLTPLVGREPELGLLRQHWEQAKAGAGQVVCISGEPGIGKSRLVQEFKAQLAQEGAPRRELRCSSYHQNSALYPLIDHLQRLLQFAREDAPVAKLDKLHHTLSHYRSLSADTFPLLAALLSLPHPEGYPPLTMSPQKQREKTQAAFVAWLVEEAAQQPVCTTWEDLHWADPSTLEVLQLLIDHTPTACLYVLLTFRPEFTPPWGDRSHLRPLTLSRLGRMQTEAMVERVTGGKALPPEVVEHIVAKTDGVPLFVEELTKTVLESVESLESIRSVGPLHRTPLQTMAIPATLQDSLMARLDRLGPAKEIAQLGATLGREFSYELIHAVSPFAEAMVQHGLQQLVAAELVYQEGLVPQAHYLFKHALIQDTTYHALLKSTRQQYHTTIARVLEDRFPETVATQPELVAHHYTEAGLLEHALPYWQQAGERATQRSAYVEAIRYLTRGLELLQTLPDTPERTQQELTLQLALGVPLMATKGYAAPEVEHTYTRARATVPAAGRHAPALPSAGKTGGILF
jgi:predicted ATPase/class 3 adenylate cyclase